MRINRRWLFTTLTISAVVGAGAIIASIFIQQLHIDHRVLHLLPFDEIRNRRSPFPEVGAFCQQ